MPTTPPSPTTRRMDADTATSGLDAYRYPSALDGDDLFRNRHEAVLRDIRARDAVVDFDAARRLYDTTSTDTDDDGHPAVNEIRGIVEDLLAVVKDGVPLVAHEVVARRATYPNPEVERLAVRAEQQTADAVNRYGKAVEALSGYEDARAPILADAAVVGVGYTKVHLDAMPSVLRHPSFADLLARPESEWSEDDWKHVEMLIGLPSAAHAEADGVFWQAGVASVYARQMLRVTEVRRVPLPWARDVYEVPDLIAGGKEYRGMAVAKAGGGAKSSGGQSGGASSGGGKSGGTRIASGIEDYEAEGTVTLAETWQIEPFVATTKAAFRMGGGDAKDAKRTLLIEDAVLVRTVIGPDRLLEKQVLRPGEAPMRLPFIPHYIKTSARHPYGFSIPAMLHLEQLLANRLRGIALRQAEAALAPGTLAMLAKYLGASDDPEDVKRKLATGEPFLFEGDEDIDDIGKVFQFIRNPAQGVQPAILQMLAEVRGTMERGGQSLNLADLGRARSFLAKQQQIAAADRGKARGDLFARPEEDRRDLLYEHLRVHARSGEGVRALLWRAGSGQPSDGAAQMTPLGGEGYEAAETNRKSKEPVLDLDANGLPMRIPEIFGGPENPSGLVYRDVEITHFDTSLEIRAVADGRGDLPADKLARLNILTAWQEMGLIQSIGAMRHLALPERIAALDDAYAAEERKVAAEAEAQKVEAQQAIARQAMEAQAMGLDPQQAMEAGAGAFGGGAPDGGAGMGAPGGGQPSALAQSVLGGMREARSQAVPVAGAPGA